jgi:hypothetical protein
MTLHKDTFGYRTPTDDQLASMQVCREATEHYAMTLMEVVPEGADRTFILRKLRTLAMWVNVAITRHQDGSLRP